MASAGCSTTSASRASPVALCARFAGLVITEVNPDHVPEPGVLRHFVTTLTGALAGSYGNRTRLT